MQDADASVWLRRGAIALLATLIGGIVAALFLA